MKLRVSSPWGTPETFTPSEATVQWAKEITEKSGGKITFEFFWGAALAGSGETADLTGKGVIDVALITPWWTESKFPIGIPEGVFPLFSGDPDMVMKMRFQLQNDVPAFDQMYAKSNLKYLIGMPSEDYGWNFLQPIKTFADFKGRKVSQPSRWTAEWMKSAGMTMVTATIETTYQLMQSKVIEGNMLPLSSNYSTKVYEVAKYFLFGFGVQINRCLLINQDTWNKLGPDAQLIVRAASVKMVDWYPPLMSKRQDEVMAIMKKTGAVFEYMTPEMRQQWLNIVPDVPNTWATEVERLGYPGWRIVDRLQEIMTNFGYKFERKWGVR